LLCVSGDTRGAGTDAEVYIILYGGRKGNESSGKITLDGKFERYDKTVYSEKGGWGPTFESKRRSFKKVF